MIATAWCVYCRSVIPDDADRCPSCEKPLTDGSKVIRCPYCGKYILKNSAQCRYCGKDPHAPPPAEPPASEPPASESDGAPPAEQPAPAEATAPTGQNAPAQSPAPASKSASAPKPEAAAKPAPAKKAAAKKTKLRRKRLLLLIPPAVVLAIALFFGGRAIFGKKDTADASRAEYIAACKSVSYAMISRDPARYEGKQLTFSGTVTELVAGSTVVFHIEEVNLDAAPGSTVWYAAYTLPEEDPSFLHEGDEVTVYGECTGAETYLAQPGESVTIPALRVMYCEKADLERLRAAQQGTVLTVGEEWTIDGLCTVTVTGVKETKDRVADTKKDPIAVYYVDYTYTNLGYVSESADGIYVSIDEAILDSAGQMGYSYPNPVKNEPRSTPVGETCKAQCCVGLEHVGPFQLVVNVNDPVFNSHTARFNIMPD